MEVATLKTKEQLNEWELMELRTGKLMISKIIDGKTYYQVN